MIIEKLQSRFIVIRVLLALLFRLGIVKTDGGNLQRVVIGVYIVVVQVQILKRLSLDGLDREVDGADLVLAHLDEQ